MKQKTIEEALKKIHERKRKAESDYKTALTPLLSSDEYVKLDKKLTRAIIENARKESAGEKTENEVEILQKKLDEMKKAHAVDLKPNYDCKLCNDEGFKDGEMCKCLKKEISHILLMGSGFEKLESFEEGIKTSEQAPLYKKMQEWCNSNFKKNLVFLAGPTGVGKTYLIRCMANELIERGIVVKIVTAFKLNQDFREFSKIQSDELLQKYLDCEVLFIDDLGTEPIYKNVTIEYLYLIINERKMRKLPTVITTNLELGDIMSRYDERIYSRIADREGSITIYMQGNDRRLQNKNN